MPALLILLATLAVQDPVDRLIAQLGADSFEERVKAEDALVALGDQAEQALKAAAESKDTEVSLRAKSALARIQAGRDDAAALALIRALPASFAEVRFTYRSGGQYAGSGTLKTREVEGKIVLEEVIALRDRDGKDGARHALTITCTRDRLLPPLSLASRLSQGEKNRMSELEIRDGKLLRGTGAKQGETLSDPTVVDFALYRIIGTLPQRPGYTLKFDLLKAIQGEIKPLQVLTCVGEETIDIETRAEKCSKWTLKGPATASTFWVCNGRIRRLLTDEVDELIFAAK